LANTIDDCIAIVNPPMNASNVGQFNPMANGASMIRTNETTKFEIPQITFIKGEESPLPGGLANGVGNLFPDIPWTKWGIAFTKKPPIKKSAI
jgi:hypothetical protein